MRVKKISAILLIIILLLSAFLISCIPFRGLVEDGAVAAATTKELIDAGDFTLLDLNNNKVSLSDFKGKVVVLNFWATWCPPCKAEIPDFIEVFRTYKDKDVQFLGISDDNVSSIKKFVGDYGINYTILLDGSIDAVMSNWGISSLPTTVIINGDGKITFAIVGMVSADKLTNMIELSR
ncbi:MAG: TlpA disulfide reductase family protein [Actinomycetota bacterium]